MPKYLLEASYSAEGLRAAMKEGFVKRREAVTKGLTAVGGQLDALYFSPSQPQVIVLAELPDALAAASLSFAVESSGSVVVDKMTALLTAEEADQAAGKKSAYRAPGAKKR